MEEEITLRDEFAIQALKAAMETLRIDGTMGREQIKQGFLEMAKLCWMAADAMIATR
jgi:hypothetical protein